MMETFAFRWFSLLYPMLGILLILGGSWLLIRTGPATDRLLRMAGQDTPPAPFITTLRILILLTIPSILFSLWPLSWAELLFSGWSLVILFTGGQLLVRWPATAEAIRKNREELPRKIRFAAANMLSIGLILLLLTYHLLSRQPG